MGHIEYDGWQCEKSPTSAHHWVCQQRIYKPYKGCYDLFRCKYCHAEKLFPTTYKSLQYLSWERRDDADLVDISPQP